MSVKVINELVEFKLDPLEFLKQFSLSELKRLKVINTGKNLLNGNSVFPLINLMRENKINRLEVGEWFIDSMFNFRNPRAKNITFRESVHNLKEIEDRYGVVFDDQNKRINPYYERVKLGISGNTNKSIKKKIPKYDTTVFINEVISSPENRVNLNLYGMMLIEEFRHWFFERLGVDKSCIIFPAKNVFGDSDEGRPDLVINDHKNNFVCYIEIELGAENSEQISRYNRLSKNGKVFSITGLKNDEKDLSLEEIYEKLVGIRKQSSPQVTKYINSYEAMFVEYVLNMGLGRNTANVVSDKMREHPLVKILSERLDVSFDLKSQLNPGDIVMNTRKEKGFSLRIYSRKSKTQHSLSIMAISGGRPFVILPSNLKLRKYLPEAKEKSIKQISSIIKKMGFDIDVIGENQTEQVPVDKILLHLDDLLPVIKDLSK